MHTSIESLCVGITSTVSQCIIANTKNQCNNMFGKLLMLYFQIFQHHNENVNTITENLSINYTKTYFQIQMKLPPVKK